MMRFLRRVLYATALSGYMALMAASPIFANTPSNSLDSACRGALASSSVCQGRKENIENSFAANLTNTMLFLLGAIAVVMIVIGGIKYATANGDASQIKSAKDTIMYSVVGLVVAIMAWGIVTFVVNQFG